MTRQEGYITLAATGLNTFNLGFSTAPTWAEFIVSEKTTGDNVAHLSIGSALLSTNQHCNSTYADAIDGDTFKSNAFVVQHYERVSGSITKILSASFDSFTTSGIKLNVDIANNTYQVLVKAGN